MDPLGVNLMLLLAPGLIPSTGRDGCQVWEALAHMLQHSNIPSQGSLSRPVEKTISDPA